jgi:hypothetical protein
MLKKSATSRTVVDITGLSVQVMPLATVAESKR